MNSICLKNVLRKEKRRFFSHHQKWLLSGPIWKSEPDQNEADPSHVPRRLVHLFHDDNNKGLVWHIRFFVQFRPLTMNMESMKEISRLSVRISGFFWLYVQESDSFQAILKRSGHPAFSAVRPGIRHFPSHTYTFRIYGLFGYSSREPTLSKPYLYVPDIRSFSDIRPFRIFIQGADSFQAILILSGHPAFSAIRPDILSFPRNTVLLGGPSPDPPITR